MMNEANNTAIDTFWQQYIDEDSARKDRNYVGAFSFGNTAKMADEIARLVLEGTKTATSMLVWELEEENQALWKVNDESIVLDGRGSPVCVLKTTQLEIKPFNAVDAQFVYDYGEGDCSLEWWNGALKSYYFDLARKLNKQPTDDMPIICERFRVVYSLLDTDKEL